MGIFIGSGLALIISGAVIGALSHLAPINLWMLGTIAPWRLTFLLVGVPGVAVSCLVFTIREPLRRNLLVTAGAQTSKLSIREVAGQLKLRWQSVLGIAFAFSFQSSCTYGIGFWAPTFLIRVHGWGASDTGWVLGIITLTTGCFGMYVGGRLCDRWQQEKIHEALLRVGVIGTGGAGVFFVLAMLVHSAQWSLALMVPGFTLLALPIGTAHASMQLILPNEVRGQISALYLFILNMGLILGPYLPGAFNDYLFKNEKMLAYSIALSMGICAALAVVLLKATYRPYRAHYRMMHEAR